RVEILKVLMAGARILILVEPTAVLTDQEAARLLDMVRGLARGGAAVALVTHRMSDVKAYADRVTVMRGGRSMRTVATDQASVAELVQLTVGESLAVPADPPRTRRPEGPPRLMVRGLSSRAPHGARAALGGVDLALHGGEIYGLAGVGGNGQSELAAALMGLDRDVSGEIVLQGHGDLKHMPNWRRRALRMAAIPADRYGLALAGPLSVAENFGIGRVHEGRYGPAWRLDARRLAGDAQQAVEQFDVQGVRGVGQKAALLSGGNAQKLVLAREFGRQPSVVLAHSPSRGLDVRAGAEVHARLRAARDAGAAVLLISEDLDEVLGLADRVGVMVRGRIVAEFEQPVDRQAIGQAMVDHG
ncbi:MAG TPA: ATP-binding cassette domain-containing protein, partial [Bordetella sp.]